MKHSRRAGRTIHDVSSNNIAYNVTVNTHLSKLFEFQSVLSHAKFQKNLYPRRCQSLNGYGLKRGHPCLVLSAGCQFLLLLRCGTNTKFNWKSTSSQVQITRDKSRLVFSPALTEALNPKAPGTQERAPLNTFLSTRLSENRTQHCLIDTLFSHGLTTEGRTLT